MKKQKDTVKDAWESIKTQAIKMDLEVLEILKLALNAVDDDDVWPVAKTAKELRIPLPKFKELVAEKKFFHPVVVKGRKYIRKRDVFIYLIARKTEQLQKDLGKQDIMIAAVKEALYRKTGLN